MSSNILLKIKIKTVTTSVARDSGDNPAGEH
jgi:hypothetical protein